MSTEWSLLAAPLAAGLLVLATHVPLGIEVLRRGIIFIDLAIAQVAALGVVAAGLFGWQSPWAIQGAAVAAALAGALLLTLSERRWPDLQEALIGLLFVTAAAAGILLLADNPHGGEHLKDLLAGQVLWVGWEQLAPVAGLYLALLLVWFGLGRRLGRIGFYTVFALAVTASVQLVGVYLVFSSLIIPALGARALRGRRRFVTAYAVGALGYALGLALSALLDLPSGAVIVWTLAGCALAGALAAPAEPASA